MYINIKRGVYGSNLIENQTFETVDSQRREGRGGYFIKVLNRDNNNLPKKILKVYVDSGDYEIIESKRANETLPASISLKDIKSDTQLSENIKQSFEYMDKMIAGCADGLTKGIVISGAPGVGKSFNVQQVLEQKGYENVILEQTIQKDTDEEIDLIDEALDGKKYYVLIKGHITPLGLYQALYQHKDKIIVFDDSDSVLMDPTSLNLLKSALDSYERRMICWNSRAIGGKTPKKFEFTGSIIFISNIHFDMVKEGSKLKCHLDAIQSRCHYLDLSLKSNKEKILRIKQVIAESDLLIKYDLTSIQKKEIMQFIVDNQESFKEISLRTALKVAEIRLIDENNWQKMAKMTCMGGKIKESEIA